MTLHRVALRANCFRNARHWRGIMTLITTRTSLSRDEDTVLSLETTAREALAPIEPGWRDYDNN